MCVFVLVVVGFEMFFVDEFIYGLDLCESVSLLDWLCYVGMGLKLLVILYN